MPAVAAIPCIMVRLNVILKSGLGYFLMLWKQHQTFKAILVVYFGGKHMIKESIIF